MSEQEFQRKIIDQLARVETKQDLMLDTVKSNTATINQHSIEITENSQSAKAAHHRIDGIFYAAGVMGAIASFLTNTLINVWDKLKG